MNLLFIDCEVANKHNVEPKICQFGYVLIDESLNIIGEDNFFINPGENEDFSNIAERQIELEHAQNDYEFYRQQNQFPYYYEKIKSLLTNKDTQVIGWAISNDLFYISSECKRYGLDDIDVKAFDVQLFYKIVRRIFSKPSLSNAIGNLFAKEDEINKIKEHDSKNDSLLTFKVLEKIAKEHGSTLIGCLSNETISSFCYIDSNESFRKEFLKLQAKETKQQILNNINWDAVKRYVFFDTECANCFDGKGKICEFGWAASSSNFQEVNKGEYVINPGKGTNFRFSLIGRKNQDDLHLKYEDNNYEAYRKAPEFDNYIGNINFLFNQKDILIFGFEVKNDFSYLDYSYKRYGYKPLNIFAIDVRILYKKLLKETGSLETIIKKYLPQEVTNSIIVHESSYDAISTMLALKFLINKFSVSLKDLIKEVGSECIISSKWDVEVTKLNVEERELKDCISKLKKKIKKPFDKLRSDRKKDEKYISTLLEPSFAGKRFSFSNSIQKSDIDCIDLCKKIESSGYILALETRDVDILICSNEEEINTLKDKIKHDAKFVTLDDFLSTINSTSNSN